MADFSALSKEELLALVSKLDAQKKYGLVWEADRTQEVFEADLHASIPFLAEVTSNNIVLGKEFPNNIFIEGDNYHALSVLNYTHQGKVDVIFIDPPYNTGNKTWRYNNDYVESDDTFKHSKWISFMSKRLKLSKNLLTDDGIIIVSIDDYEVHTLRFLLDEIFGENNRLGTLSVINKKSGRTTDKFFATSHEYYYFYAKNAELATIGMMESSEETKQTYKLADEEGSYKWRDFLRTGGFSTPEERPNSFYPIYFEPKSKKIDIEKFPNAVEIFPIDSKGKKRVWRQTRPSLMKLVSLGAILIEETKSGWKVRIKDRIKMVVKPKTVWDSPLYDAATHGTKLLETILNKPRAFDFPKSVYAVRDALSVALNGKDNAIILDYFGGSGTTAHAVTLLNKDDDGNRKFIICTNNENNIASEVCFPRIKNVIKGVDGLDEITGIPTNLFYFKTSFVQKSISPDETRIRVSENCHELIKIKEQIFETIESNDFYRIHKNDTKIVGVYHSIDPSQISALKNKIQKFDGEKVLYCFTLDNFGLNLEDFDDLPNVRLEPIPQSIVDIFEGLADV